MNTYTPKLAANAPVQPPAVFFEAPRRQTTLRPVAPISVKAPLSPAEREAREEKQALRVAFATGLAGVVMWGALLYTLATSLQVPTPL